jgi:hypothetical protein
MATTIAAAGDLIYGTANDAYAALSLGTAGKVLKVNSGATAPEWAVDPTTDVVTTAGDLIYGTGADAVARLGIGTAGQVLKVNSGATAPEWGSSGTNWTYRGQVPDTANSIAYNGSNLYVIAGNGGSLSSSPDGITWTTRTSGFGASDIRRVAYGNGLWVAVGSSGIITTSTDGTTWTARTSNMSSNDINDVVYANSLWVAVGTGGGTTNTGGIIYSSDGTTWTRKSQSVSVGGQYFSVVYNGTNWIVGTSGSSNNYLYASAPSGTWTAATAGSVVDMRKIFWDGTRHIFYTNAWKYSTSTTLSGQVEYKGLGSLGSSIVSQSAYYNNVVYFGELYYNSFIPASTSDISTNTLQISPTTTSSSSSPYISGGISVFFAGAVGLIIAGNNKIYTSF